MAEYIVSEYEVVASVPKKVMEQAKELRVIGRLGVGDDSVDIAVATARGLSIVFASG